MKERPILFSGPMVRAILEGRKTMTRRVVKFPFKLENHDWWTVAHEIAPAEFIFWSGPNHPRKEVTSEIYEPGSGMKCPFGVPGDRLWVRETFAEVQPYYSASDEIPDWVNYVYRSDYSDFEASPLQFRPNKWKPSIFMPRTASRILLEIESIRVERLQDITDEDAQKEGYGTETTFHATDWFQQIWEGINGPESWEQNSWVWVIEFKCL